MKHLPLFILIAICIFSLTACGNTGVTQSGESTYYEATTVEVHGRDVDCITSKYASSTSISCNWDAYNQGE